MPMVKLPDLETVEMRWIIQAMEHYSTRTCEIQGEQAGRYEQLVEMLKRREAKARLAETL